MTTSVDRVDAAGLVGAAVTALSCWATVPTGTPRPPRPAPMW